MGSFLKNCLNSFNRFYVYHLPSILVWVALIFLTIKAYDDFFDKGDFSVVITIYFAMIALVTALASVTFAFSKTKKGDDEEFLVSIGELFLYASLALISSLLISWLSFEAKKFFSALPFYKYYFYFFTFAFTWGQMFLLFAANSLHGALVDLERYLWFRVREKIK